MEGQVKPYQPIKDYMGEALITLLLYFAGLGIVGLGANIYFLIDAKNRREQGTQTVNVGCLQALLIVNLVLIVFFCLFVTVGFVLPVLFGIGTIVAIPFLD